MISAWWLPVAAWIGAAGGYLAAAMAFAGKEKGAQRDAGNGKEGGAV